MKKRIHFSDYFFRNDDLKKTFRKPVITFLLLILSLPLATSVFSQQILNVDFNQATLQEVMNEIEKQTNLTFFYSGDLLDISQTVTIKDKTLIMAMSLKLLSHGHLLE